MADNDLFPGFGRVDVDGARIHAVTAGNCPPALLLHGFPQSHVCWHKVAPALVKHATLVIQSAPRYTPRRGDRDSGQNDNVPSASV
jgi:haloacetate dehalogenase